MSPAGLLLAAAVMSQIRGVGVATVDSRPVVTVFSSGSLAEVQVSRQGGEVTVSLSGVQLGLPFTGGDRFEWQPHGEAPPIQALRIESGAAEVTFRIAVAAEVPFEVHRDTTRFTLVFGERAGPPGGAALVAQAPKPVPLMPLPRQRRPVPEEKRTPFPEIAAGTKTAPAPVEAAPTQAGAAPLALPAPTVEPAPAAETAPAVELAPAAGATPALEPTPAAEPQRLAQAPVPLSPVPASEAPGAPPPSQGYVPPETQTLGDVEELRKRLFPGRVETEVTEAKEGGGPSGEAGLVGLGPFHLRPSVVFAYVDAEAFFLDSPEVARDRYLQIQPSLGAELGLHVGGLKISYTPRFRGFASFRELQQITHEVTATLDTQLTPALAFQANDRFVRGIIESNEVDPGREYFFNLGRFTRNTLDANAKLETGGRLTYTLGGTLNHISFDEPSSFFGYETRELRAGALYDVTPGARLGLAYRFDQVPAAADRPIVESHAHGLDLSLEGEIAPLTHGRVAAGYRNQSSPLAGEGGRSFSGLVLGAELTHEFSRGARLRLNASRSTQLSAFEQNAFYVSTAVGSYLTLPLPLDFSLGAGAGYQWNGYRTVAPELGEARSDRIFSWSVGLGRPLTRWSFIRLDYRKERRFSNIESLENDASAFILQFGLGWFGTPSRP